MPFSENHLDHIVIPVEVARCPCCDSAVQLEFDEWEADSGCPIIENGRLECTREQCFQEYQHSEMWRMPYVYWLPLEVAAQRWAMEQPK